MTNAVAYVIGDGGQGRKAWAAFSSLDRMEFRHDLRLLVA